MKFWRVFSLVSVILFFESIILTIMVLLLSLVFIDSTYVRGPEVFIIMPLFFLMYKSILELWLLVLILYKKNKRLMNEQLRLRDMKLARVYASPLALALLIIGAIDNPDMFLRLAILYVPSVIVSFYLIQKLWKKGLLWIYGTRKIGLK